MRASSIAMSRSPDLQLERTVTGRNAKLGFFMFAVTLITVAYMMPISDALFLSTYDNYTISASKMETSIHNGTLSRQIAMGSLGLFGFVVGMRPLGKKLQLRGLLVAACIAYVGWCSISLLWSDEFGISARRLIALSCELAAGLAIAKRCSPRQFVWIVFTCTLAWFSIGVAAELSLGTFRPWETGYRFSGIFHPNEMGASLSLLIMSALYLARGDDRRNRWLYMVAAAAGVFLLLTGSRTALLALLMAIFAWWLISASITQMFAKLYLFGAAVACIAFAMAIGLFSISADAAAMGRADYHDTSSLSGRIPLWTELMETYVEVHPLTGWGYGAFWTAEHVSEVSKSQYWLVGIAHSAYVELLLDVGAIGLAFYLMCMLLGLSKARGFESQLPFAGYGFIAMLILFVLMDGLTETNVGISSSLSFFVICGIGFFMFPEGQESQPGVPSTDEPMRMRCRPARRSRAAV